jgi:serine/threonine protein kinase
MGVVYKARDVSLDRFVAIKFLPAEFISNADRRKRFVREAKTASALNHPGIITVHEIDTDHEEPFIVMEYVEGKSLNQIIHKGRLSLADTLNFAMQISDALAAAHAAGIIHRDLKPANIMVGPEGRIKVLDFGLAKLVDQAAPATDESTEAIDPPTAVGTIFGTASYMSPEQAQGGLMDNRSDIFSFGAVLYEMITGRRAFSGSTTISTLAAILNQEPRPATELAPELPQELERIVSRCLRKDPSRRFQHMDDLKVALQELREESDSGKLRPALPHTRRLSRRLLFACGAVALGVAIAAAWYAFDRRSPPPMTTVPLTSYPGYERHASFSPDGRQVTFSWNGEKQDNYDIYVVLTSGGAPLRLTTNPAPDTAPAWSPDGRYIAYIRDAGPNGGVYLTSPLGGPDRKIAGTTGHSVCWTSDSTSIGVPTENLGISLVSVASGEQRKLTSTPQSMVDDDCAFSEDGKYLAFVRWSTGVVGNIFVESVGGANPRRITPEGNWIRGLAWIPGTADLLAAMARATDWNFALVRFSADARPTSEPSRYLWAENASHPSLSQALRVAPIRLVYERAVTDYSLYALDLPSSSRGLSAAQSPFAASTRDEMDPQFSPDGRKVAFASDRSGNSAIWVGDRDGSNIAQLTNVPECIAGSPRWSPDSMRLAFDCSAHGNFDIYLISAGGGPARRFTSDVSQEVLPSWSHDGRWIYFSSNRSGIWQVWKAQAVGGSASQVTRGGGYEPFESLDGKLLYYSKESAPGVWNVPVGGGPETRVLDSARHFWWAMADTGIYFVSSDDLQRGNTSKQLNFYSFETRTAAPVGTIEHELPPDTPSLAVSRDGRHLMLIQRDHAGSDLVLVDNFR